MRTDQFVFVHSTDWHLQPVNPPSRLGSYAQDIIDKIKRVGEIAKEYEADFTTCGGDVWNKKDPKGTTHEVLHDAAGAVMASGLPCYCVPGNHDLRFDRDDTLPEQPLGVFFKTGVMVRQVAQVLRKDKISVRLRGIPFAESPDFGALMLTAEEEAMADCHVLSLHIYASPSGGSLHGTKVHSYATLAKLGYDVVLLGHYHADQGVTVLPGPRGDCTIVNIGSLSRGDYGDENLDRVPKCCVVTISKDGVETEEVPVGAKPASEVFDLRKKVELKEHEQETEAFVTELSRVTLAKEDEGEQVALEEEVADLGLSDAAVIASVKEYIDKAVEMLQQGKAS